MPLPAARHSAPAGLSPVDLAAPSGWFAVATGAELPAGAVRGARVGTEQLVVWRDPAGRVVAATAWCPHLGAHLGHVGRVTGGQLECGFHGFRFDSDGTCVATGYGGRPPKSALRLHPVREVNGAVFVWYHPDGDPPSWTLPELPRDGWNAVSWRKLEIAGHPLEVTENSVDLGHFRYIHGYDAVSQLEAPNTDGAVLRARYSMSTRRRFAGVSLPPIHAEFDVAVHGLGFSVVDLHIRSLATRLRLLVLATLIAPGRVELRLGASAAHRPDGRLPVGLSALPDSWRARVVRDFTASQLRRDVGQDRVVWETKRHLPQPLVVAGDGPIMLYRRWARQFFPSGGSELLPGSVALASGEPPMA